MINTGWSTVQHNSMREIPLVFLSVFAFIIASSLFAVELNMVAISLAVFFVSTVTALYGIGQKFLFDPLFPERVISRKKEFIEHLIGWKLLKKGEDIWNVAKKTDRLDWQLPHFFKNKKFADSRVISTFGNTNFASGFFCASLPFILFLCIKVSLWFLIALAIVVIVMWMTESRAARLSLFASALVFILLISQKGLLFDFLFLTFGGLSFEVLALILIVVAYLGSEFLIRTHNKWKSLAENTPLNNTLDIEETHQDHPAAHLRFRFRYWRAAWELIKRKPLHGFGLRTYRKEVYQAQADLNRKDEGKFLGEAYQTPQPRECHNDFIENFVEGGFIGGLLFLAIVGIVIYNGFIFAFSTVAVKDFLVMAVVLSGLVAGLVNAFFFFPLRLGSSALMFWTSLALVEGISGSVNLFYLPFNWFVFIVVAAMLAAMLWEGVIKPNIGNYWFTRYQLAKHPQNKEKHISKAVDYAPRETIYQTHRLISYLFVFPDESEQCAEVIRQHYDGMTPAWTMFLNSARVKIAKKQYSDALRMYQNSIYHLPSFEQSKRELSKVFPYAPFTRRKIILKKASDESINAINLFKTNIKNEELNIQLNNERTLNVVQTEKVKMNVPHEWPFDFNQNMFISPTNVPEGSQVIELGLTRIPIVINPQQQQQQQEGKPNNG